VIDSSDMRVAFLTANEGVEQSELTAPWQTVKDIGARPELLAPSAGQVQAFKHLDKAHAFDVDRPVHEANPGDYIGLVVPGGVANADQLRNVPEAVAFARQVFEMGIPAAVICHGPWLLVEADLVGDRVLTSWPSLATDIRNAGGRWVNTKVQLCTNGPNSLVTSRKPDDLPAFCRQLARILQRSLVF
jgi:protease I